MSVINKIDKYINKKLIKENEDKISQKIRSFSSIKKLMECDWSKNKDLKEIANEAFCTINSSDEVMAQQFIEKLIESIKQIGSELIGKYDITNEPAEPEEQMVVGVSQNDDQ